MRFVPVFQGYKRHTYRLLLVLFSAENVNKIDQKGTFC